MRSFLMLALSVLVASCSSEERLSQPEQNAAAEPVLQEPELQKIVWVDRTGAVTGNIGEPQEALSGLDVSPDGQRVVVRRHYLRF